MEEWLSHPCSHKQDLQHSTLSLELGLYLLVQTTSVLHSRPLFQISRCKPSRTGCRRSSSRQARCLKTSRRWLACTSRPLSRSFSTVTSTLSRRWQCARTFSKSESNFSRLKNSSNSNSWKCNRFRQSKASLVTWWLLQIRSKSSIRKLRTI